MKRKPVVAISMGDPAGIGPEIVLKAVLAPQVAANIQCVIVGDKKVLEQAAGFCGISPKIKVITCVQEGEYLPGTVNVIDLKNIDMDRFQIGKVSGMCGKAAYEYIEAAICLDVYKRQIPASTFINVDFPAPFSPQRANTSPGLSLRSTSSNAVTPGKDFVMCLISKIYSFSIIALHWL